MTGPGSAPTSALAQVLGLGSSSADNVAAFAALGGKLTGTEILDQLHAALTRYVVLPVPGGSRRRRPVDRRHACGPGMELRAAARHHQPGQAVRQKQAARHHRGHLPRPAAHRQHQPGRAGPLDQRRPADPAARRGRHRVRRRRPPTTTRTCAASSTPGTPGTVRTSAGTSPSRTTEHCPTFAMAALAGIGDAAGHDHRPRRRGDDAPPGTRRDRRPLPRAPRRRAAEGARRTARRHGSATISTSSATPNRTCPSRTAPPTRGSR